MLYVSGIRVNLAKIGDHKLQFRGIRVNLAKIGDHKLQFRGIRVNLAKIGDSCNDVRKWGIAHYLEYVIVLFC